MDGSPSLLDCPRSSAAIRRGALRTVDLEFAADLEPAHLQLLHGFNLYHLNLNGCQRLAFVLPLFLIDQMNSSDTLPPLQPPHS